MIKYCKQCAHCDFRQVPGGVEVLCNSELAPESWRRKWIHRTTEKTISSPLMCPVPDKWFKEKK